eukprot:jgi/Hompol1/78/HPOL_005214-RA
MTVARVYKAEPNPREFSYTGQLGAIALVRTAGGLSFRLIDIDQKHVIWDHDASRDIKYQADRPFFHSFIGSTCIIGFSFADEEEAATFNDKVQNKDALLQPTSQQYTPSPSGYGGGVIKATAYMPTVPSQPAPPAPVISTTSSPPLAAAQQSPATAQSPSQSGMVKSPSSDSVNSKKAKESGGFFLGRSKSKKESRTGGKIDKSMISAPTNFEHVSHVGYNPKTGFSAQNIPMEWKIIFQKAGITEEQLQDKKTAKAVVKFMKQHADEVAKTSVPQTTSPPAMGNHQQESSTSAPTRRAPPPPPPSRAAGRAPPPPPPSRGTPSPAPTQAWQPAVPTQHQQQQSYSAPAPIAAPPPPPPVTAQSSHAPQPPAVPSRAPPTIPSRGPPPPPAQQEYAPPPTFSSGGPPPPPPPPPPAGLAPPPPPPAVAARTPSPARPAAGGDRGDFLTSIRDGVKLNSASNRPEPAAPPPAAADNGDSIAAALSDALKKRIIAIGDSDSEDEDDEEDW